MAQSYPGPAPAHSTSTGCCRSTIKCFPLALVAAGISAGPGKSSIGTGGVREKVGRGWFRAGQAWWDWQCQCMSFLIPLLWLDLQIWIYSNLHRQYHGHRFNTITGVGAHPRARRQMSGEFENSCLSPRSLPAAKILLWDTV